MWRLHLANIDVGCRWQELAATWDRHADGTTYPFNDWHAAMAYLGAGHDQDLDRVLSALRKTAADNSETGRWAQEFCLPLIEGFAAFWRGDFTTAAERLYATRFIVNAFGGSHAQRDIIDLTLVEAALRGGLDDLARAMVNKRLMLKPHGRINAGFQSRITGRVPEKRHAA